MSRQNRVMVASLMAKQGARASEKKQRSRWVQKKHLEGGNEQNRLCCSFARLGAHLLQPTAEKTHHIDQLHISHDTDRMGTSRSERSTSQYDNKA